MAVRNNRNPNELANADDFRSMSSSNLVFFGTRTPEICPEVGAPLNRTGKFAKSSITQLHIARLRGNLTC